MKVRLIGKDYEVGFNFATIISYERATGKAFDPESLNDVTSTLTLGWCSVMTNNAESPEFDEFLRKLSPREYKSLQDAISAKIRDWYAAPPTSEDDEHGEGEEKNA